jgi:hypothetical protein
MRGKICVFCERLIDTAGMFDSQLTMDSAQHPDVITLATGDNHRAPLMNIANTQDLPDDSDTRALMLMHIQARAAKDLVKNLAVAVPGTCSIYVHAVTIIPSTEGARQLGVAAQQIIETTLFSSEPYLLLKSLQTVGMSTGVGAAPSTSHRTSPSPPQFNFF